MKKIPFLLCILLLLCSCSQKEKPAQIAASTLPVYEFTTALCEGTDITVDRLVTQSVSCLHDYTLQAEQMRIIAQAETVVLSGGGLEVFLDDALQNTDTIDASANIELICHSTDHHEHQDGHTHDADPHIWLSPANAKTMSQTICEGLCDRFPQYASIFRDNLAKLHQKLDALAQYGFQQLSSLSCRKLITFHDGFAYFAEAFDLEILMAIEEDSGSEASAADLIHLIQLTQENQLPAVFTECNGSTAAASIIGAETGAKVYALDMAMSERSYFDAMYHNIDTIKEALG